MDQNTKTSPGSHALTQRYVSPYNQKSLKVNLVKREDGGTRGNSGGSGKQIKKINKSPILQTNNKIKSKKMGQFLTKNMVTPKINKQEQMKVGQNYQIQS